MHLYFILFTFVKNQKCDGTHIDDFSFDQIIQTARGRNYIVFREINSSLNFKISQIDLLNYL